MIPFKSIPAARYRPAHKCAQWGRSCSSRKTRKQTFMHFSHVRRMYKKKFGRAVCSSKWEKQLLQGIMGKLKRQQPDFSIIWKLSSAKILGDMLSTASQLELRRGKKGPWHIWRVFSRQTVCEKGRKKGRWKRRDWGVPDGCRRWGLHPQHHRESVFCVFCSWAFITLVNARQAAPDLWSHTRVKALTHADHGVGHLLLSLINARQGQHLLHMWGWLEV